MQSDPRAAEGTELPRYKMCFNMTLNARRWCISALLHVLQRPVALQLTWTQSRDVQPFPRCDICALWSAQSPEATFNKRCLHDPHPNSPEYYVHDKHLIVLLGLRSAPMYCKLFQKHGRCIKKQVSVMVVKST